MKRSMRYLALAAVPSIAFVLFATVGREDPATKPDTTVAAAANSPGPTASVDVAKFQFQPPTVTLTAGGTVTWVNRDGFEHSVVDGNGAFTGSAFAEGVAFSHTYDVPGTYQYFCGIHNSMVGTVVVD